MDLLSICLWICIVILIILILYVVCSPPKEKYVSTSEIDDDLLTCIMNIAFPKNTIILTTTNNSPADTNQWMNTLDWECQSSGMILASGIDSDVATTYHLAYYPTVSAIVSDNMIHGTEINNSYITPIQGIILMPINNLWLISVSYYYFNDESITNEYDVSTLFPTGGTYNITSYSKTLNRELRKVSDTITLEGLNTINISDGKMTFTTYDGNDQTVEEINSLGANYSTLHTSMAYGIFHVEGLDLKANTFITSGSVPSLPDETYKIFVDMFCPSYYYDLTSYVKNNSNPKIVRRFWVIPAGDVYKVVFKVAIFDEGSSSSSSSSSSLPNNEWELDLTLATSKCSNNGSFYSTTNSIYFKEDETSNITYNTSIDDLVYYEVVLIFQWENIDFSSYSSNKNDLYIEHLYTSDDGTQIILPEATDGLVGGTVLTNENIPIHTHPASTYEDLNSTHTHEDIFNGVNVYHRDGTGVGSRKTRIFLKDKAEESSTETEAESSSHTHTISNPSYYGKNSIPDPHTHGFDHSQIPKFYVKAWKRVSCSECMIKSNITIDSNRVFISHVLDVLFPVGTIIISTEKLNDTFKSFFDTNTTWSQYSGTYIPISGSSFSSSIEQNLEDPHLSYTDGYALQYFNLPIHYHNAKSKTESDDFSHYHLIKKAYTEKVKDTLKLCSCESSSSQFNLTSTNDNCNTAAKKYTYTPRLGDDVYNGDHTHDVEVSTYGKISPEAHRHTLNLSYLNVYIYIRK